MVNCVEFENFKLTNKVVVEFEVPVTAEQLQNTVKCAQKLLGQPYGYLGLLRLALRKFGVPVVGDNLRSAHCSEFIATLFPNLAKSINIDEDFLEPVHLHDYLAKENYKKLDCVS